MRCFSEFFRRLSFAETVDRPAIMLHAFMDICGDFNAVAVGGNLSQVQNASIGDAIGSFIVTLPLLLYSLFLIHKIRLISTELTITVK